MLHLNKFFTIEGDELVLDKFLPLLDLTDHIKPEGSSVHQSLINGMIVGDVEKVGINLVALDNHLHYLNIIDDSRKIEIVTVHIKATDKRYLAIKFSGVENIFLSLEVTDNVATIIEEGLSEGLLDVDDVDEVNMNLASLLENDPSRIFVVPEHNDSIEIDKLKVAAIDNILKDCVTPTPIVDIANGFNETVISIPMNEERYKKIYNLLQENNSARGSKTFNVRLDGKEIVLSLNNIRDILIRCNVLLDQSKLCTFDKIKEIMSSYDIEDIFTKFKS